MGPHAPFQSQVCLLKSQRLGEFCGRLPSLWIWTGSEVASEDRCPNKLATCLIYILHVIYTEYFICIFQNPNIKWSNCKICIRLNRWVSLHHLIDRWILSELESLKIFFLSQKQKKIRYTVNRCRQQEGMRETVPYGEKICIPHTQYEVTMVPSFEYLHGRC